MYKSDIFNKITDTIIQKLRDEIIPWRKSWRSGLPRNYISKRPYNGINFLSLCSMEFSSPYYLTYLQCKQQNGFINKGEQGSLVVFWKIEDLDEISRKELISDRKVKPILRHTYVFNNSQTSLNVAPNDSVKIISAENILTSLKEKPVIKHNFRGCYYNIQQDIISIPTVDDFDNPEEYYSNLFHELLHWTAHQSRLCRDLSAKDDAYAIEELIAELGSSYLCGLAGISPRVLDNQTAYILGWLSTLSRDRQIILKAAVEARKAVNYLLPQADIK